MATQFNVIDVFSLLLFLMKIQLGFSTFAGIGGEFLCNGLFLLINIKIRYHFIELTNILFEI